MEIKSKKNVRCIHSILDIELKKFLVYRVTVNTFYAPKKFLWKGGARMRRYRYTLRARENARDAYHSEILSLGKDSLVRVVPAKK